MERTLIFIGQAFVAFAMLVVAGLFAIMAAGIWDAAFSALFGVQYEEKGHSLGVSLIVFTYGYLAGRRDYRDKLAKAPRHA